MTVSSNRRPIATVANRDPRNLFRMRQSWRARGVAPTCGLRHQTRASTDDRHQFIWDWVVDTSRQGIGFTIRTRVTSTRSTGASPLTGTASIFSMTSSPSTTRPNTVYWLSSP